MKSLTAITPNKFEILLYAIIAVLISLLGNLEFFSRQLGLIDAATDQSVIDVTRNYMGEGLAYLDGFTISAVSAVFVFWSFIGVLTLTIIHSVYDVYREVSQDVQVATKFYHPGHYSTFAFWRDALLRVILNSALYIVALFAGFFVSVILAPIAINAVQDISNEFSPSSIAVLVFGLTILWGGLLLFGLSLRLILLRKQFDL